jgi:hypothetical protein
VLSKGLRNLWMTQVTEKNQSNEDVIESEVVEEAKEDEK